MLVTRWLGLGASDFSPYANNAFNCNVGKEKIQKEAIIKVEALITVCKWVMPIKKCEAGNS